jgi:hypothetical protein
VNWPLGDTGSGVRSIVKNQGSHPRGFRVTVALLSITHLVLAVAIALSALCGSYSGGDWTWWLTQASTRKFR